jgi:hypothetical protein
MVMLKRGLLIAAGVLLAVGAGVGVVWAQQGSGAEQSGSRSEPGVVACANTIAVGTVTAVKADGVSLAVERYLKPDTGPATLTVAPAASTPAHAWSVGERVLVVVHRNSVDVFEGAAIDTEWAWMSRALPDSRAIDTSTC